MFLNQSHTTLLRNLSVVIALFLVASLASAKDATVDFGYSRMDISLPSHDGATLTIHGEGISVSREFNANQAISFNMSDNDGNSLPNGQYSYTVMLKDADMQADLDRLEELSLANDPNTEAEANELSNRMQNSPQPTGMTGGFIVNSGQITDASAASNSEQSVSSTEHEHEHQDDSAHSH